MGEDRTNGKANGLNGASHGAEPPDSEPPEPDLPEEELPPPPKAVSELAESCMRFVQAKYGVPLDLTPDTLSLIDQYARDARRELVVRPEADALLVASLGAYFGEVVRRAFFAEWYVPGDYEAWRLYFRHVYIAFNPIGVASEALSLSEAEGFHAHLLLESDAQKELDARLAAIGPVDEEEYWLFSTRFDVLAMAVEIVRARMIESHTAGVTFGPDDYE